MKYYMPNNKKMSGGSPASDAVLACVPMKGGSPASSNVISLVQPVCMCNQPTLIPPSNSTPVNFYQTTGGARSKKNKKTKNPRKPKKSKKRKTGGSVPYYMVMSALCSNCQGVQIAPMKGGANGKQKGGSAYLMVHNSRSMAPMSDARFSAFSQTGTNLSGAQLARCAYNGPMFSESI